MQVLKRFTLQLYRCPQTVSATSYHTYYTATSYHTYYAATSYHTYHIATSYHTYYIPLSADRISHVCEKRTLYRIRICFVTISTMGATYPPTSWSLPTMVRSLDQFLPAYGQHGVSMGSAWGRHSR